ncbi:MAG: PEGA domain-containing protein [Myxococcales bacterium]|nr:PEGA domain-containing protein [Myxococcales bacterium]
MRHSIRSALIVGALLPLTALSFVDDAAAAATNQAADEEPQIRIAVLPITAGDKIDDVAREELLTRLRVGMGRGEVALVPESDVDAAREACVDCSSEALARSLAERSGATHYTRARVDIKSRDYAVRLELVEIESGRVAVESEQTCEICGLQEVGEQLETQGAFLQSRLQMLDQEVNTGLLVESEPRGALVFIDDVLVGSTPYEAEVAEGSHSVRVSLNGHLGQEREVVVEEGAHEVLRFTLERAPADPKLRVIGGALLGGGLALFAGGVVLIGFDGEPFKPRCDGADVDADGDCRFVLDTKWGGVAALTGGAIAATVGAMLLIRFRRGSRPAQDEQARANLNLGLDLGGVTLRGRF